MESTPAIADTVVLRYFLLVDQFDLLLRVLGKPLMVSRVVYDPEDGGEEPSLSEVVRSIHVQRQRAADNRRSEDERKRADLFAVRLAALRGHVLSGTVSVVDMSELELELFGRLGSASHTPEFGLTFPLDDGEAATLAISIERNWVFASDDGDALKAMRHLRRRHPYQRIRKILIEAVDSGVISRAEANTIHAEMRESGFWDPTPPFPSDVR
jgi:predicted nucleic acid-binding protein